MAGDDRLRIAVFHDLPSGGAKRCLFEYCRNLSSRGHLLDAYLPDTADEEFLPLDEVVHKKRTYPVPYACPRAEEEGKGGPVKRWIRFRLSVHGRMKNQKEIARAIDEGGYDLAFVHHSSFIQAPFVLRYLKTPSVYFMQEYFRTVYDRPDPESGEPRVPIYRRYHLYLFRRMDATNLRGANRVLANSNFSRESIQRSCGIDPQVCYLGVNTGIFRPLDQVLEGDCVLSVGALYAHKGHGFIIAALALLPEALRPRLVIVADRGDADEREALERLAGETGVDLEILTGLSDEQLCLLYNQARVVLFAPYREPFGFVPLESMACGTPVIGVREGGLQETIEDGVSGRLVDRDETLFARALEELLSDNELRIRMGQRGRESVLEKWSWARSTDELLEQFHKVLYQGMEWCR
jgi:glycosyltransferase involved in cell wall biosynthesis